MTATRKLYNEVADTIKFRVGMAEGDELKTVASLVRDLANDFKRDNRAFRFDRFFEACGLDSVGYPPLER